MSSSDVAASKHLLAGCTAGFVSVIFFQPLDLLKTRLQQKNYPLDNSKPLHHPRLNNIMESIWKEKGIRGFWKGTVPTIYRNVPGVGLYFLTMGELRQHMTRYQIFRAGESPTVRGKPNLNGISNLGVGAFARTVVGYILMPLTVVKVRYESSVYNYSTMSEAFRHIVKNHGFKGLFVGSTATILRDAPSAGLYLYFYESGKRHLSFASSGGSVVFSNFISGVFAGVVSTTLTQPLDTLRTQRQLYVPIPLIGQVPSTTLSNFEFLRNIIKEDGLLSLFRGSILRLMRKSLGSAVTWVVYEEMQRITST